MWDTIRNEAHYLEPLVVLALIVYVFVSSGRTHTHKRNSQPAWPFQSQKKFPSQNTLRPLGQSSENTSPTFITHFHCVGIYPNGEVEESCCGTRFRAAEQARVYLMTGMNTVFLQERSSKNYLCMGVSSSPSSDRLPVVTYPTSTLPKTQSLSHPILHPEDRLLLKLLLQDRVSSPLSTIS